jgi:hypothetical protein
LSTSPTKTKHLVINQEQQQHQSNESDPLLASKIEDIVAGLLPYYSSLLHKLSLSNKGNVLTIISYINTMRTEANLSDNYRRDIVWLLFTFSNYFQNKLSFKHRFMAVITFIQSFKNSCS